MSKQTDDRLLLTRCAVEIEATDGADKPAKVNVTAYNGGVMKTTMLGNTLIDLDGLQLDGQVTLLADHNQSLSGIAGTGRPAKVDGTLRVEGTLSQATEAGRMVLSLGREGIALQASVGVSVDERQFIRAGETVTANGRTHTAPQGGMMLVKKASLREVSILPLGADSTTSVRIAATGAGGDGGSAWSADEEQIRANERERLNSIDKICSGKDHGAQQGRVRELRAKAIAGEISIDYLRAEMLEILRNSRHVGGGTVHTLQPDRTAQVLEAALCVSSGMSEADVGKHFDEQTMNAAVARENRGAGIHSVFDFVLETAGQGRPRNRGNEYIKAAFEADRMLQASTSGFSTVSLPGILSNAAGKVLLSAYLNVNSVWRRIAFVASADDFKPQTRYRLEPSGEFEKVGATGELKSISLTEQTYSQQIDTEGCLITLPRQMIINDDLSAFMSLPRMLGRLGAVKVEESVFTLLLSNLGNFFHADNNNYIEGASTALQIPSLTTLEQKFFDQVDGNGKPIMTVPRTLLVPTTLSVTANQLTKDITVVATTTANAPLPAGQPHAGKFTPATSPWLNNSSLTGNSATGWYLFADPGDVAAIEIAFLQGQQLPIVESQETSFNTLGISMRAYHDWGVAFQDPRGAAKSKGAA